MKRNVVQRWAIVQSYIDTVTQMFNEITDDTKKRSQPGSLQLSFIQWPLNSCLSCAHTEELISTTALPTVADIVPLDVSQPAESVYEKKTCIFNVNM